MLLGKAFWVVFHQGPIEFFKRIYLYLKKHGFKGIFFGHNKAIYYKLWMQKESIKIKNVRSTASIEIEKFLYKPVISIIMPVYNTNLTYLEKAINSVCAQIYPLWELCIVNDGSNKSGVKETINNFKSKNSRILAEHLTHQKGIAAATNAALNLVTGEFVGFLDHDDELAPHALLEVARILNKYPEIDIIYTDEDRLLEHSKRCDPFFKPDWSPDLLLSMNYMGHFLVIRRKLIREIGGLREGTEGSQDYDLVLRAAEKTTRIAHIPEILYHWRITPGSVTNNLQTRIKALDAGRYVLESALERRGLKGQVRQTGEGRYHINYNLEDSPLVSIIIPTKDNGLLLQKCVDSIKEKSTYKNYEIIIINNNSTENYALNLFKRIIREPNCRVIAYNDLFNYSKINNFAVSQAKGQYLLFLNNDTEIISSDWIEEMLGHTQQRNVGAVGAKLLFPDNKIQHGGVIVGLYGTAGHAFYGLPASDSCYMDLTGVTRNCSAVTGACLMMRRRVFEEIDGFDEDLDIAFNDVDICLRLIERGYSIVWIPHAVLYHHEAATRGYYKSERNISYFLQKWAKFLKRGDPFYNKNLSLDRSDFMVKV